MLVALAGSCIGFVSCAKRPPSSSSNRVAIQIASGSPVPDTLFGFNSIWPGGAQGVWDSATHRVRPAFVSAARDLGVRCLRHPGGTLSHLYHFDRAIGPISERKPIANAFTKDETEIVEFGTDEFLEFCRDVGAVPLIVVAYAEGSPEEAAAWVAYLNGREGDRRALGRDARGRDWGTVGEWAARRARNGHAAPYSVGLFEIGNETDMKRFGCTVAEYAARFGAFADAMRAVDSSIRLIAAGHRDATGAGDVDRAAVNNGALPPAWNETLLKTCGDRIDFVTVHFYGPESEPDDERLLDAPRALRQAVDGIREIARRVAPSRAIDVALTETNAGFHTKDRGFSAENSSPRAALFVAATWLEAWDAHIPIVVVHTLCVEPIATPGLEGWRHFGVLVRDGESVSKTAVGRAMSVLARGLAGGTRLSVRAPDGTMAAAVKRADGRVSAVVLSRSRRAPRRIGFDLAPGGAWHLVGHERFDLGGKSEAVSVPTTNDDELDVEPMSLHLMEFAPR